MLVYWFLPMIVFLGIITSYEDIKFGKIRNKWVVIGIGYGILVNLNLFFLNKISLDYIIGFSANAMAALAAGFAIWLLNLWTAGDAKLFFAYSTLVPIYKPYSYSFFIAYLSNTFIPLSIIFLFYILFGYSNKKKLFYLKKTFDLKTILGLMPFIFGFSWIIGMLFGIAGFGRNIALSFGLVFILYYIFDTVLKIKVLYIGLLLSLARLIFDKSVYSLQFIGQFLLLIFLFLLVRMLILPIGSRYLSIETKINDLKKGMVPAETIVKINGRYVKRIKGFSLMGYMRRNEIGKPLFKDLARGLSDRDISKLKSLQKKMAFKTLRVQTTVPFAPFLFLGALLTIVFQGSFVKYLFLR